MDVNGDGRLDLVSPDAGNNALLVFTNLGKGNLPRRPATRRVATLIASRILDVNRDGKVDLVSANAADNTLTVLTNNGGGIFGSNATYSVGSSPRWVTAADINGSGWPALDFRELQREHAVGAHEQRPRQFWFQRDLHRWHQSGYSHCSGPQRQRAPGPGQR